MHQVWRCLDHPCNFLGAQHDRQLSGNLRKDQVIIGNIPPLQNLPVQKTQGGHPPLDGAWCKLLLFEQVKFELAYLVASQLLW